jgi:hypothetical protein
MSVVAKHFFDRDGTEYVREDGGVERVARPGEKLSYVAEIVHERRQPFGRTRPNRR